MKDWYNSLEGQYVLNSIDDKIGNILSEIFGYYAVEFGVHTQIKSLLNKSRIKNNITIYSELPPFITKHYHIIAEPEFLPIVFDNIDLVIASHVFEASQYPHQVLREIDRILVPEGHCLLIGFNPISFFGKSKIFRLNKYTSKDHTLRSIGKMKDWFRVRGFEIIHTQTFGFRPVLEQRKIFSSLVFLEKIGKHTDGKWGSVYLIHAKKTEIAQTPKLSWTANKILKRKPRIVTATKEGNSL